MSCWLPVPADPPPLFPRGCSPLFPPFLSCPRWPLILCRRWRRRTLGTPGRWSSTPRTSSPGPPRRAVGRGVGRAPHHLPPHTLFNPPLRNCSCPPSSPTSLSESYFFALLPTLFVATLPLYLCVQPQPFGGIAFFWHPCGGGG